jgi:hypothetical protein
MTQPSKSKIQLQNQCSTIKTKKKMNTIANKISVAGIYLQKNKQRSATKTNASEISPNIDEKDGVVTVYSNPNSTAVDLPTNMEGVKVLWEYSDYQSRFYIKTDGDPFESTKGYIRYLGKSMKYLEVENIRQFFYNFRIETLLEQFEVLKIRMQDRDTNKKLAQDIECAFRSFLNFLRFRIGTHDMYGNIREKAVKVQFLSGLKYYRSAA